MGLTLGIHAPVKRQEAVEVKSHEMAQTVALKMTEGKSVITMAVSKYSQYGFMAEEYMVIFEWVE